jgi:hypothetical protein
MRWLSEFSLLVLMFLVLLSNAESTSANALPTPTPSNNSKAEKHDRVDRRQPPQMVETTFEAAVVKALGSIINSQESAHKQTEANEEWWRWPPSPSCAIVFVTLMYVGVAYYQLRAIRRQADIAEKSANAAKISADVADIALRADRPFLLIEGAQLINFQPEQDAFKTGDCAFGAPVKITFMFNNCGKNPDHHKDKSKVVRSEIPGQ